MSEFNNNRVKASVLIVHEFMQFASTIPDKDQEWFFDGRNRDGWMDDFIAHLKKRYQKLDRIASND